MKNEADANSAIISSAEESGVPGVKKDEAELAKMGYKQELRYVAYLLSS